jgi:hypothetical protein
MTQTTEAACLLQSGAIYHRRLGLVGASGEVVFAGVKPGAVSVYFGDAPIDHFDFDGRWQRAFVDGRHYLKGLDATVRSIDREHEHETGGMVLRRATLPYADAADLDDSIRSAALGLIDDLDSGRLEPRRPPEGAGFLTPEDFREFLDRVIGWDSAAWFAHRERYLATYGPLPFLPPDCPNPLILQATLGDRGGRAFGGGPAAEHYVRSPDEFEIHARAVAALTGRRIAQHRTAFLVGADVLLRPVAEVSRILRTIGDVFPIGDRPNPGANSWDDPLGSIPSIHSFLDDFSALRPDLEGWRALRAAQLARVTVGVESGAPEIRASFGRSWEDREFAATVRDLRDSGIGVGIVALVGAGGRAGSSRHIEATVELLGSLGLGRGNLVTLVDARSFERAVDDLLTDEETAAEVAAFKASLAGGPKVVAYNPVKRWA